LISINLPTRRIDKDIKLGKLFSIKWPLDQKLKSQKKVKTEEIWFDEFKFVERILV